jgi:PAS domain S-box-containing protein
VAFEPIPEYGWGLAAELSDDALYTALGTTARQINVGLALLALLLSAVAALVARLVTDPLLALNRMAGEVAQGHSVPESVARRLGGNAIVEVRSFADRLLTMERALTARAREQEALFRRAFESQVVGVAHTDLDGRFTRLNDRFCEMVGWKRADLVGILVRDIHGPGAGPAPEQIAALIAGATNVVVSEISAPQPGGRFAVTRTLTTVHRNPDGRAAFLVTEVEDITEQRALQTQLAESQKMESIGMLAGGVAHDFNNLLTPILGYTDMVSQSLPEGSDERDCLAHVTTAAERARDLTQQLLAFGRRQALVLESIDVRRNIAQIAALLRPLIRENIAFSTVIAPDASSIRADQGQLQQILMNLGVNAVDSMPQGGVLTIEVHDIVLAGATRDLYPELPAGRYVSIAVHDTGEGIPPESLPRIFEPFFTTKVKGKGTGLGLSTVYGIVTQHQGAIRAASKPGRGTTFTILFPALAATPRPGSDRAKSAVVPTPGRGASVLVVEDEEVVRRLVVAVLRGAGYDVLQASSGEDAILLMASQATPVTALVTDVVMTGMDGRVLSDRLRADNPGLRTLFMSGYAGDVLDAPGIDPAATQILKKPFAPNELLAGLSNLLR